MTFIKKLSWPEVFSIWRTGEVNLPRWIEHYTKSGFNSWDDWRNHTVRDLHCENLSWELFELDRTEEAENFYGGPFRAWMTKYYHGKTICTFEEIVSDGRLAKEEMLSGNFTLSGLRENFPRETSLIGLLTSDNKVVILEGMHRGCALAMAALEKRKIAEKIYIALAKFPGEIPVLGEPGSPT